MIKPFLALFLLSVLILSGCASQQARDQPASIKEFKIKATHAGYVFYGNGRPLLKLSIDKGDKVRLLATTDTAEIDHNHGITIDEYSINEVVDTANENSPKIIEFTADKTGNFRIYCKPCLNGSYGKDHPDIQAFLTVI